MVIHYRDLCAYRCNSYPHKLRPAPTYLTSNSAVKKKKKLTNSLSFSRVVFFSNIFGRTRFPLGIAANVVKALNEIESKLGFAKPQRKRDTNEKKEQAEQFCYDRKKTQQKLKLRCAIRMFKETEELLLAFDINFSNNDFFFL